MKTIEASPMMEWSKWGAATPTGADDSLDAASRRGDTHQHDCKTGHTLEVARRHVESVACRTSPLSHSPVGQRTLRNPGA